MSLLRVASSPFAYFHYLTTRIVQLVGTVLPPRKMACERGEIVAEYLYGIEDFGNFGKIFITKLLYCIK